MSASRSRRCSPTTPIVAEDAADLVALEIEDAAGRCSSRASRRRIRAGPSHRSRPSSARALATSTPRSAARTRSSSSTVDRPPFRRAAGDARRHRALRRRRATCSKCTAPRKCRTATATRSRACSAAAPSSVHLHEGHVGGGFGIRGELYPEDVLVCVAALRFERPVKWIEDRREHLIAANHSRAAAPSRARRGRRATAASSASTTNSSTTRAPICAPTAPRPGPRRRHAARALPRAGLSRASAISG